MSNRSTLSLQYCIRNNSRNRTVATDEQPMQFVELRLGYSNQFVSRSSHQILQQTPEILISDTLLPLPLRELQDPPFLSHFFVVEFLSSFNISTATCDALFQEIASFALQLAAGNDDLNFHIIAAIDLVQTLWVDLDPERPRKQDPAPASVIERLMKEKFDGFGREEAGDCSVCYDDLHGEKEVSRLRCDHVFHKCCILKWLHITNSCPLCRMELKE